MDSNTTRSEQVIDDFKKQKLTNSALHKIRRLIKSFDDDRQSDVHWARIGLIILIFLLAGLSFYFFGTTEIKIS
jgi:hypothetical protein